MYALYKNTNKNFEIHLDKNTHIGPHLHDAVECVYVTEGTLEIGITTELYHMNAGDFAIVFPNVIHHYQVFDKTKKSNAIYLLASPVLGGSYLTTLQQSSPVTPIIPGDQLHPDILYAMNSLYQNHSSSQEVLHQAFLQIIITRALEILPLCDKEKMASDNIIYRTVAYIAEHFTEPISLTSMASDLYVSPYALSRVFSSTFHMNFNKYLNNVRLEYARHLLTHSDLSITEIYEDAGFESQRTFNRVFTDACHMSPRDYKKLVRETISPVLSS